MRRATSDHAEHGGDHTAHGGDFPAIPVLRRRQRIVMPEQLIGSVDEMDVHRDRNSIEPASRPSTGTAWPKRRPEPGAVATGSTLAISWRDGNSDRVGGRVHLDAV